ncbi:MAG: hypothetical protein ABI890_12165 [Lapillicoccus sp.]
MTRSWRWAIVAAVVAFLVALPLIVRSLPVGSASGSASSGSAGNLLARILASAPHPYAGYAESTGTLALPTAGQLTDIATLLGGRTQVRTWWRSADDWRYDTVTPAGELSSRTSPAGTQVFDFEDTDVAVTAPDVNGAVRLPRVSDTLPPLLAARLLSGATPAQVTTLPSRRVAGRPADGLRMRPGDPLSSIDRVDVWADRASGVPLLVEVYARNSTAAAMSSTFLDFTDDEPAEAVVAFTPPPGSRVFTRQRLDLVGAVARTRSAPLPGTLLDYPRVTPQPGLEGIGQYGSGVTQLAVGVLPDRVASSLRDQLKVAANVTTLPEGIALSVGPVGLLVTDPQVTGQTLLLSGTLTPQGLALAATELRAATGAGP